MHPYVESVVRSMVDTKIADDVNVDENMIIEDINRDIDYMNAKLGWLSEAEMEDFYDALKDN